MPQNQPSDHLLNNLRKHQKARPVPGRPLALRTVSGAIPLRNPRHQRPQQRQIDQQRQRETASSRARRGVGLNQQRGNQHGHDAHHRRQTVRHGERSFSPTAVR